MRSGLKKGLKAVTSATASVRDAAQHMPHMPHMPSRGASSISGDNLLSLLTHPKVSIHDYQDFWRALEEPADANNFLAALAKHLSAERNAKSSSEANFGMSNGSVLATLLLLVLYAPVSADTKEMRKRLQSAKPPTPDAPLTFETVMQMVGKATEASEMLMMVHLCSDVAAGGDGATAAELTDGGEIATSLLFGYLLKRLQENHRVSIVISAVAGILTFGRGSLGISRPKALALLHMLREILRHCPTFTDEELKKVLKELGLYSSWALPVGGAAAEARHALLAEMSMRGASLFHALSREVPWLRADCRFVHAADARRALVDAFTVHVVTDDVQTTDWARAFQATLIAPTAEGAAAALEACRLALCSMLNTLFRGAADASVRISPAKIASLPFEQVLAFSAEAATLAIGIEDDGFSDFDDVAAEEAAQNSAGAVAAGLRALAEGISSAAASFGGGGGGGAAASTPMSTKTSRSSLLPMGSRKTTLTGSAAGGGEGSGGAADVRTPRLPPLTLRALDGATTAMLSSHVLAELREAAELCGHRRYMYEPLLPALYEKLRQSAHGAEPEGLAPCLRICIAGGDGALHRLVQAYTVLRCAHPDLFGAGRPLRFYLVPIGRPQSMKLASFLAANDGWYRRHIFAPNCAGSPTVPHLILPADEQQYQQQQQQQQQHGPPPSSTLPFAPLRACLTDYLRAASATLHLQLYEVACYATPPAGEQAAMQNGAAAAASSKRPSEPPFVTIVFAQSLEVVAPPGGAGAEGGGGGYGGYGGYGGAGVTVSYTMVDPRGVEYPTPSTIAGRFASLGWHTYSSSEPFHSPASGRLQMRCCLTSQKGDKGGGKAPMRYVKQSAIHAGANAGLGGAGAQDGSLTPRTPRTPSGARDERFGLLVDGEYYGPFAYCHVSPCVVPGSSEQISLPLATFFPIGDEDGDGIDDF